MHYTQQNMVRRKEGLRSKTEHIMGSLVGQCKDLAFLLRMSWGPLERSEKTAITDKSFLRVSLAAWLRMYYTRGA